MTSQIKDLDRLVARYAALERQIGALITRCSTGICSSCEKVCCRADVGRQALESWWLRQVSRHVHGRWWPDDWETAEQCVALSKQGCTIEAGKPMICWSFVCDRYAEAYPDLWDAAFYSFLADLLWEVGQLSGRVHLEYLEEQQAPRYMARIEQRLGHGEQLLQQARGLLDPRLDELHRHRLLLSLLCRMPRCFRATTQRSLLSRLDLET